MSLESGLCQLILPSCLDVQSSSKLLRILHAHSKISHLLALAALLAEMASSAHLACKAQLRCLITHPSFTTRVELVQILSLHLAHCIFMLNFLLLPQWVSYLRTGVCLVCLSISLAYSTEPGTGWVLNQYPCSFSLFPGPAASPRAFCLMETPSEQRQWGCPGVSSEIRSPSFPFVSLFWPPWDQPFLASCLCVFLRCPGILCKVKAAWVFSSLSRITQCLPWNFWIFL